MVSASGVLRTEGFRFALDNGAWTAHNRGASFDGDAFQRAVVWALDQDRGPDFIVLPDIVEGGIRSQQFSTGWRAALPDGPLYLLAVQDGMTPDGIRRLVGRWNLGVFLGGSTEWKLATMLLWGRFARRIGAYYHVGRVNSVRRVRMAADAGADSFDGSGVSRYATALPCIDSAARQLSLIGRQVDV